MSTPNESTPLISTSVHADTPRQLLGDQQADTNIEAQSQAILVSLEANPDASIRTSSEPVNLLISLYASHRLDGFLKGSTGDGSIGSILFREIVEDGIRQRLDVEIGKVLDSLGRGEVDDETLYEALWRKWEVCQGRVSALDLMIEQDEGRGHRYLSHPIIVRFIRHLYRHGPTSIHRERSKGILHTLQSAITPRYITPTPLKGDLTIRRAHILHFVSYLALWALTITSAMRPKTWATRTSPRINTHSPLDIIWMISTSAAFIRVSQHPHHNRVCKHILLLPSALALITCWTTYGFTFLTLSIPFLTISLIRPEPPSIPFLLPSLLPHSIRLWDIIIAGFTGWALLWPVIIVLCVMFSISLNGDIFRGFFVTSTISTSDPPVEEGIAPYGTRLAIFGTIIILAYLAICLSISNMASRSARHTQHSEDRESESEMQARVEIILGARWLLGDLGQESKSMEDGPETRRIDPGGRGHPPVPIPFNLLLVPLDIVLLVFGLARSLSRDKDEGSLGRIIGRIRYFVAILMIGIPCWVISFVV